MQLNISKKDLDLLLNKLSGDNEMNDVYNNLLSLKERSSTLTKNKMKLTPLQKMKDHPMFDASHKIIEDGKTVAVSLKLLLSLWESKGCTMYGAYNDVFGVLRANNVIMYMKNNDSCDNVPTEKFKGIIIEKEIVYNNTKSTKLFFTNEASKIVKDILKNEGMLEESGEI